MVKLKSRALIVALPLLVLLATGSLQVSTPSEESVMVKSSTLMDENRNKIFDTLEDMMYQYSSTEKIPVRVVTRGVSVISDLIKVVDANDVKYQFSTVPGFAASLTIGQINALSSMEFVVQIEYDKPVQMTLETANYWFGTEKARSDFAIDGNTDGSSTYSKDDIVIAVIDTGIDASHVDLDEGKVIGWKDFVNGKTSPYDDQGHGTHVSSIVAGDGDGDATKKGVAPGAALVGIKVLDSQGSGALSDVEAGVQWAIDNKDTYGIEIISMSLGSAGSSDGTDSLSQTVNSATTAGITIVVAAGNEGPGDYTIGSPAAADKAITVGAAADVGENGFNIASFSSRGPTADGRIKPDIMAPGYQITAAQSGSTNGYVTYSGTSMATPFVSGTIALMLQENPNLTPQAVKDILRDTATDFGPSGKDSDFGWGMMDGYEAIDAADGADDGSTLALPGHVAFVDSLSGTGDSDTWNFDVVSTSFPISVTLIMLDFSSSVDFDLYLYDPSGTQVGKSEGTTRQELVTFTPTSTGTYQVKGSSYKGSGSYTIDVSAGINGVSPDNPPSVSITSPVDGDTVSSTVRILVDANDDNTVSLVELAIGGGTWFDITANVDANGNYYFDWDTTGSSDGDVTLDVRATDDAGQVTNGATVTVTVSNGGSSGTHEIIETGTVTSGSPDVTHSITVNSVGYIDITLSWSTSADLDFYVYDPSGNYIDKAYTTSNPETLRIWTENYGVGTYSIRVNLYSGADTTYSLKVEGYERQDVSGTVSSSDTQGRWYFTMPNTGSSYARLSWSTSADLDFYVYDEAGNYVDRAYTTNNPETLAFTVDVAGDWSVVVDLNSGGSTTYTLSVYVPADNLS